MDCFPNLFKAKSINTVQDTTKEVWMTMDEPTGSDNDELDLFDDWDMPINDNMDEW